MWIREDRDGTLITCRIHANARKDSIDGVKGDQLVIHLNAPAIEGKANKALLKLLSERLDMAKTRIVLRSGEKSKTKVLLITGTSLSEVSEKLLGY